MTDAVSEVECTIAAEHETPYGCAGYRLATDAEWEYAARGGTRTGTYNGNLTEWGCPQPLLDPIAWHVCNSGVSYAGSVDCSFWQGSPTCGTHPVGQLRPNAWGLYDILGNNAEHVLDLLVEELGFDPVVDPFQDPRSDPDEVLRSGRPQSYDAPYPTYARASAREMIYASYAYPGAWGIRPVRTVEP